VTPEHIINTPMKSKYLVILATAVSVFTAHATTFTWDASGGAPLNDGGGNWNATGGTNWFDGISTYGAWGNTSGDTAVFGSANGAAGTVTVGTVDTGGLTFNAAGSSNYTLSGGTITLGGTAPTITTNADAVISSTLAGTAGLTKAGTSKLTLSGTNSGLSGGATISAGTLQLNATNAAGSNLITLNDTNTGSNNTTLVLSSAGTYSNAITIANHGTGASAINLSGGGTTTLITGTISINKAVTINNTAQSNWYQWGSAVQGTGTLTVANSNNQRLILNSGGADANWIGFTGDIHIGDGSGNDTLVELRNALGASAKNKVAVNSDGILQLAFTNNTNIGALNGSGIVRGGGDNVAHLLTLGNGDGSGSFSGTITNGTGTTALTKAGIGTQILSGNSSYTGGTNVNAGALSLLNTTAKPAAGTITVAAGATLGLGVSGGSAFTSGNVDSLFTNTLTNVSMNATSLVGIDTTNGDFTYGTSVASTTRGLNKLGANTLTLTGTNSYTGATTVSEGKLVINGNISTSVLTTVNGGATLGGTGTVGALTVASGGILAPGNSAGILNASGNTDLQASSNFNVELNGNILGGPIAGTNYDQLNVIGNGTVTLAGALNLTIGTAPVNGELFFILANDHTDAIAGTRFSNASVDNQIYTLDGQQFQISYNGDFTGNPLTSTFNSVNGNDVVLMAVPEPAAALLGSLGLLALLRRRR
jgi:fibronectin-binding autotransporter adhesin